MVMAAECDVECIIELRQNYDSLSLKHVGGFKLSF